MCSPRPCLCKLLGERLVINCQSPSELRVCRSETGHGGCLLHQGCLAAAGGWGTVLPGWHGSRYSSINEELHTHGGWDGTCHLLLSPEIPHPCSQGAAVCEMPHVCGKWSGQWKPEKKKSSLWAQQSLVSLILNWAPLHVYVFLCFLLRAHKGIDNAEVEFNYRILTPVRASCK